jgi:transposase
LVERGGESENIGRPLIGQTTKIFDLWHQMQDGQLSRGEFVKAIKPIQGYIGALLHEGTASNHAKTHRTCRNLLTVEAALWSFVEVAGIEPTNNAAERPLRRAVLWRRKSLGTKSNEGSQFVGRILSVVTTLRQQGRDVLDYLTARCGSPTGLAPPHCLLPDSA